ncbi:MAG: hypothetical protein ACTIH2_01865 [Anaerococcus sp.]
MDPLVQVYANKLRDSDYENAVCIVEIAKLQKENDELRKEIEELKEEKSENKEDDKYEKETEE